MSEFIKKNLWAVLIAVASIVGTYYTYGYRIAALETKVSASEVDIKTGNVVAQQLLISTAKIEKDIEYIKMKIDRITP